MRLGFGYVFGCVVVALCCSLFLFATVAPKEDYPLSFSATLKRLNITPTSSVLIVSVEAQTLTFYKQGKKVRSYIVSTAKEGVGQREGSNQTPLGLHKISNKFGAGAPLYSVFVSRKRTGEVCDPETMHAREEDLILTRILELEGMETGVNKGRDAQGKKVDSKGRQIYVHGTNQEGLLGTPVSHGCIRMNSVQLAALFEDVSVGTLLWIY